VRTSSHDGAVTTASVSVLERPVYGVAEVASYLGLRSDRVRAWLDGYDRTGTSYPPVVREALTGSDLVTWGGVPMLLSSPKAVQFEPP
jgi:hypothetical protein